MSSKDCPGNELCGFQQKDGCAAKGTCMSKGPLCAGVDFGCLCNGVASNIACVGLPGGYVPAPVLHDGPCDEGGVDSGVDSGGVDSGNGDSGGAKFSCGSSLQCDASTQYCKVAMGGACCPPPSYSCEPIPAACAQDRTCTCMNTAVPGANCSSSNGGLTLTFLYP